MRNVILSRIVGVLSLVLGGRLLNDGMETQSIPFFIVALILFLISTVDECKIHKAKIKEAEDNAAVERMQQDQAQQRRLLKRIRRDGGIDIGVAGVTFSNDDGTSRQEVLEDYFYSSGADIEVTVVPYGFQSELAFAVMFDGVQVGNIKREDIQSIRAVYDHVKSVNASVSYFEKNGGRIYYAELSISVSDD